jgi:hypothetical protein
VLNGLVDCFQCPVTYQVCDLLADGVKLNRLKVASIKLRFWLRGAASSLAILARAESPRSVLTRSCQGRSLKKKSAPFSARLNFFSI